MPTHHDLRELLTLTALGVLLGLVHLGLRPELPMVAEPPAACTLEEPPQGPPHDPLSSTPQEPMSSQEAAP